MIPLSLGAIAQLTGAQLDGAAPGQDVLRVGVEMLTHPWLIGWPKLLCQYAPWRASPLWKYCVHGTCFTS